MVVSTRAPVLLLAVFLALSCGGSNTTDDLPQYVRHQLAVASDFGREIIADGTVTPAELERSVFSLVECVAEHGYTYADPVLQSGGIAAPRWHVVFGAIPIGEEERFDRLYRECSDAYYEDAMSVWLIQEGPTEAQQQAAEAEVVECVHARTGEELPDFHTLMASIASLAPETQLAANHCAALIFRGEDHFGP